MVNEGCLYKCPFRKFHFNYTAHKSKEVSSECGIFFENCVQVSARDPSRVLHSCWIRPEDMSKYGEVTTTKIVGAHPKQSHPICQAYMQESWDGGLLNIHATFTFSIEIMASTWITSVLVNAGFRKGHLDKN
jgi:hypothetical protein